MSGVAITGLRTIMSATRMSPSAPPLLASVCITSWNVSTPTIRPWSTTTSEPRFWSAIVKTASTARPVGSIERSRLPFTRRISLTCMVRPPGCWEIDYILVQTRLRRKPGGAPRSLDAKRVGDEPSQLAAQSLANGCMRARPDPVVQLVRILLQVVELVELARAPAIDPVDQLVAVG